MVEIPLPTCWLPWPQRLYPGRARRLTALMLLLLAIAGVIWTLVVARADGADRHGDYAQAVAWRPGVALYRRHWGEALLLSSPRRAEAQLLTALRLNPDDPLTIADLTTAELALGNWPQAVAENQRPGGRKPDFSVYWRLANLFLSHGDMSGYWQEFRLAAAQAQPGDFASIVSRSLTASGNDFSTLRAALPDSSAAASAFLSAAVTAGDLPAVNRGAAWLAGLPLPSGAGAQQQRRQAMLQLVLTGWRRWPAQAAGLEADAVRMGVLPGPAKTGAPPYLRDGDFDPVLYAAARRVAADPGSTLSALMDWQAGGVSGAQWQAVLTGDPAHPSAAEIMLDGFEPDDAALAQQWLLAPGGTRLMVAVTARKLQVAPQQGVGLRLSDLQGHTVADLPLALTTQWQTFQSTWTLPGSGPGAEMGTWQLALRYHRPSGQVLMNNRVLLTHVELTRAGLP